MIAKNTTGTDSTSGLQLRDPRYLAPLHDDMVRFAHLQLRDEALAEDAVQEAIEAALKGVDKFAGQASLKTWVFGILRNKIIDVLRRRKKTVSLATIVGEDVDDAALDALFRTNGHWQPQARPGGWVAPDEHYEDQAFWRVFEACLNNLPENVARVFMMREMLGLDTAEICAEVGISSNNCHVILHRARTALRSCLEKNWFASPEGE